MITFPRRLDRRILSSAALAALALSVAFAAPAASAVAAASGHGKPETAGGGQSAEHTHDKPSKAASGTGNGDNGDVKIHRSTTAVTDQRNEPHVCVFYLDAFDFDSGQSVSWRIESWPPTGNRSVVASGSLVLASDGNGHTADMSLQNGHYKLFWNFVGENGFAKQKVFWVKCPAQVPGHGHKGKKTPPVPPAPPAKAVSSSLPVTG
jgi:hypothetical protein